MALVLGLILLAGSWSITRAAVVYGTAMLVDGVLAFAAGLRAARDRRWPLYLEGTIGVAAGEAALSLAVVAAAGSAAFADRHTFVWALSLLIGVRTAALGITQPIAASMVLRNVRARRVLSFGGGCSFLFGVVFLARPGRSGETLVLLVAFYALAIGALFVIAAAILSEKAHRAAC